MELLALIGLAYAAIVVVMIALCRAAAAGDAALRPSLARRGRFARVIPRRRDCQSPVAETRRRQRAV